MKTKYWPLLAFVLVPLVAQAATVYRQVGEDGSVTFTDRPSDKSAERINLPDPKPAAPSPFTYQSPETAPNEAPTNYTAFEILSPEEGENVRNNQGRADVRLRLEPALRDTHYLELTVDGQKLDGRLRSTSLQLNELPRGQHTVQAVVRDQGGAELKRTKLVRFVMRQQSILNRQNLGLGPGVPPAPQPQPTPGGGGNGNPPQTGGAGSAAGAP